MGLLNSLIEQAKNPRGFIGKMMLKIMNSAHTGKMIWGLSKMSIDDKACVLDIGCGGGKTIELLSTRIQQGKIFGIDYSEEAVLTASNVNEKDIKSGKVMIKQASVSLLPFSDDFFDVITAVQTHYFWPDLKNDVKEVNRVLKPKGQFVLISEIYKINYHMAEYKTAEELKKLLLDNGFSSVNVFETKKDLCFIGTK